MWLMITAFVLHILLLISVFDIYFQTIIINVNENYASPEPPPAKRLVLISVDGLRAQSLYNYSALHSCPIRNDIDVKYLKEIIDNGYAWGISYARVPTESRPGHVAMLAGFFEDPNAIMNGWKDNPVDFDSVLNETRESWCWGSRIVIRIFSKGENHIHIFTYTDEDTNFTITKDTTDLDAWVWNRVEHFFKNTTNYFRQRLSKDKIIFFLHLNGIDTLVDPNSRKFKNNIKAVDEGVKHLTEIIESFYENDGKTSFLLTSDHGMKDSGSHGSGSQSETNCPIIAWGAGISRKSELNYAPTINQIDIAVLMSTLIGVPIPMNSLGVLPDNFLNLNKKEMALAFFANLKQLIAQYKAKRDKCEKLRLAKTFKPLTDDILKSRLNAIQYLIDSESFEHVITLTKNLIKLAIAGINFYQTFYQIPILVILTLSTILWIIILFENLLRELVNNKPENCSVSRKTVGKFRKTSTCKYIVLAISLICSCCFVTWGYLPTMCYLYLSLPQCLLLGIYLARNTWKSSWKILRDYDKNDLKILLCNIIFYFIAIELFIQVFFYRWILSLLMLAVGGWTYFNLKNAFTANVLCSWILSTTILAIFPLLTVTQTNLFAFILGGVMWLIASVIIFCYFLNNENLILGLFQTSILLIALTITFLVRYFGISQRVQTEVHTISWIITGLSVLVPFFGGTKIVNRLGILVISVTASFIFLCVSYEPIFLLVLSVHLFTWLIIEHNANVNNFKEYKISDIENMLQDISFDTALNTHMENSLRSVKMHDFRRAFNYYFYLLFAFFGSFGNVANFIQNNKIFDPNLYICYTSVSSSFLDIVSISCKILFIFIIITSYFRAINVVVKGIFKNVLYIILIYCDFIGIHFLFFVTNEGSWLDIGLSISYFILFETAALVILMIYVFVYVYTKYCFIMTKDLAMI